MSDVSALLATLPPAQADQIATAFHWPPLFPPHKPPAGPTDPNTPAPAVDLSGLQAAFKAVAAIMMQLLPAASPQLAIFMSILQALGLFASGAATQAAAAKAASEGP